MTLIVGAVVLMGAGLVGSVGGLVTGLATGGERGVLVGLLVGFGLGLLTLLVAGASLVMLLEFSPM